VLRENNFSPLDHSKLGFIGKLFLISLLKFPAFLLPFLFAVSDRLVGKEEKSFFFLKETRQIT
jgi:hypothetical protein